jgi:transposase-like protein
MQLIMPNIVTLIQHINLQTDKSIDNRPDKCLSCGKAGLHRHATYPRQSDRENHGSASLNPIFIQRYLCPHCQKTCSVLPECIPPRRWYPWYIQQAILLACLLGKSLNEISKEHIPGRSTCKRWFTWLQTRFVDFSQTLRAIYPEFGRYSTFKSFWLACFQKTRLSKIMWYCHQSGVIVP